MTLWKMPGIFVTCAALVAPLDVSRAGTEARENRKPLTIRDILWVWGNPEMAKAGSHTISTFAQAAPADRAQLLGVPNIVMAGHGLPEDERQADALAAQVASARRLVWEISPDGNGEGRPFVYRNRMTQLCRLVDQYPQIEGALLDDLSTVSIDRGLRPEHIRQIRELLPERHRSLRTWGVLYTMSLGREGISDYIKELDVINLATWHAKDLVDLEANVARCERMFPGKPIVLGLYLYDYGGGRRMPLDLLRRQCETALALTHAGRIRGIVFVTITDDADAVAWAADWIRQVGDQRLGAPASRPRATPRPLSIGDGQDWIFSGQPWTEDQQGIIRPPDLPNLHSRAFHRARSYKDLTAEFEFNGNYRETGTGSAGLILRAIDPHHFYLVWFPWGGQQLRAKHFWAAVAKVQGDGYIRNLKATWVPGVPSETDRWYHVRVVAAGPRIAVTVDGRHALTVDDETYPHGCVGLAGYGWYFFRNVHVSGEGVVPPPWTGPAQIPTHAFMVGLGSKDMPSGCVAPNGDVVLAAGTRIVRSKDKGRTWGQPVDLPQKLGPVGDYGSTMFRTAKGRLFVMVYHSQEQLKTPGPEILISESPDNGHTWADPMASRVAPGWPEQPKSLTPYGPLVETEDGALLRFLYGAVKDEHARFTDVRTWSTVHCKAFATRSTDGGASWSSPIELDQPSWVDVRRGTIPGALDLTEPTGVAIGNKVTVLVRPIYSPMMWQCWSYDAGAAWDAAARTTFPGYAQSMVRTKSGVILCAHRYPHYSVNLSRDDGLNWDEGTVIDYPAWAMGCLVEVEPDVLLCTYMNARQDQPLLAQLIRAAPSGIEPVSGQMTAR